MIQVIKCLQCYSQLVILFKSQYTVLFKSVNSLRVGMKN